MYSRMWLEAIIRWNRWNVAFKPRRAIFETKVLQNKTVVDVMYRRDRARSNIFFFFLLIRITIIKCVSFWMKRFLLLSPPSWNVKYQAPVDVLGLYRYINYSLWILSSWCTYITRFNLYRVYTGPQSSQILEREYYITSSPFYVRI